MSNFPKMPPAPAPVEALSRDMTPGAFIAQPYARSHAAGWWSDLETGELKIVDAQAVAEKEVLIMTEFAEATEGFRKNLPDDKLPHRSMVEVELADVMIRCFDLAGAQGHTYDVSHWQSEHTKTIGNFIEGASKDLMEGAPVGFIDFTHEMQRNLFSPLNDGMLPGEKVFVVGFGCLVWGLANGYDVLGAAIEKMEFNADRADHKIENRKSEHGKKI